MILITGGMGFIGNSLIQELSKRNIPFRLLINPGQIPPTFPREKDIQVAISSMDDERGMRAAMKGIETVYHLSENERLDAFGNLDIVDVDSMGSLTNAALYQNVRRFYYLSQIGADRASGFYLLKAKGIAENRLRSSGLNYTVFRTSMIFGEGDLFTGQLAKLINKFPFFIPVPGDGNVLLQPLWVQDLVTALTWSLGMPVLENQVVEIGGPEHMSFMEILKKIQRALNIKKKFLEFNPVKNGFLIQIIEAIVKGFPKANFWTDYLAENRTCDLDSMPRIFNLNPARLHTKLDYLIK
ncbi:MAG: SDR family oxidoreductase [Anaerolineaceae bacterium]|jgi:uncharacterized protein YbjT (DUF2867 family)